MAKLTLLDTTRTGKHAKDLERKLRRLVARQDEGIHKVVSAFQSHVTGLVHHRPAYSKPRHPEVDHPCGREY